MYTLLTGATGLVGRYLLRDLLLNEHRLAVVVRAGSGPRRESPRERIERIMQKWERELCRPLPRPVVLEGDIAQPGFALSEEDRDWVADNVDTIIHSAAILEFYGKDREREPWRTNLGGTRNMIQLCRELKIHDIHYISTAYVSGLQSGRVMEDNLAVGQTFRNDYEESKFLAESEVRDIDFADHVTVYRPAVIAGDSVTGYTNTYHGIYLYLRLMALLIPSIPPDENGLRSTPIQLRMTGDERRNIIPVDWISAVTVRLFETQEARGGTYHLAPDNPVTSGQLIRWCSEYFGTKDTRFIGHDAAFEPPPDRDANEDEYLFHRIYTENMETYEPYERSDNLFDMSNMKKFAGDIVCPQLDKTILFRYIDYGQQDRWGKAKPEDLVVPGWAEDALANLQDDSALDSPVREQFALDLTGPGGTQWTLCIHENGAVSGRPGLPEQADHTVRCDAETFLSGRTDHSALARALSRTAAQSESEEFADAR